MAGLSRHRNGCPGAEHEATSPGWGLGLLALVPSPTTTPSERATCQTRPMTTRHCLVTGANRGVGLEFVRQLLARGDRVVATCRQPGRATGPNALAGDHPARDRKRVV